VLDDKHVLNELDGSQAGKPSIRRYHYGTKVLAVTEGTSPPLYVLNDGIGSASDFWSASGTLSKSRQYDAWGNFRNGTAPAAGEAKVAYTGHQFDPETGWVYAKARYYDSGLGVFLSRDSYEGESEDAPSLHRFMYAEDNPLRWWDPSGYGNVGSDDITIPSDSPAPAAKPEEPVEDTLDYDLPDTYVPGKDEAKQAAAKRNADAKAGVEKRRKDERRDDSRRRAQAKCLLEGTCSPPPVETVEADDEPGTYEVDPAAERQATYAESRARMREVGETGQAVGETAFDASPVGVVKGVTEAPEDVKKGNIGVAIVKVLPVLLPVAGVVVSKGAGAAVKVVSRVWPKHHAWPQYLQGLAKQTLKKVPKHEHEQLHSALDKWMSGKYARAKGTEHFADMPTSRITQDLREFYEKAENGRWKYLLPDFEKAVKETLKAKR
jgi:RHS repeat-associated protein